MKHHQPIVMLATRRWSKMWISSELSVRKQRFSCFPSVFSHYAGVSCAAPARPPASRNSKLPRFDYSKGSARCLCITLSISHYKQTCMESARAPSQLEARRPRLLRVESIRIICTYIYGYIEARRDAITIEIDCILRRSLTSDSTLKAS